MDRAPMYSFDLIGRDGPYWKLFQAYLTRTGRERSGDYVPLWFMRQLCQDRLQAGIDYIDSLGEVSPTTNVYETMRETRNALLKVLFLLDDVAGPNDELMVAENVLRALLGGQEVADARARRDAEARVTRSWI